MRIQAFLITLIALLANAAQSQTIAWSGGGDATSWTDAQNWVGGQVPGAANDVVITSGAGTNVVISFDAVTIQSIQCNKAFTIASSGSLNLTLGSSAMQSSFTVDGVAAFSATGGGTTFIANGATVIDAVNLSVSDGATMTFPNSTNVNLGCGISWTVSGPNSVLTFPALTNLSSGGFECGVTIQALAGGRLNASNLVAIAEATGFESSVTVTADGANSLIDFTSLQNCADGSVTFEVSNGGTIRVPNLIGGPAVGVVLNPNSTLVANELQSLGNITANGVTVSFPLLTNFDGGTFSINDGAVVTLPALKSEGLGCSQNWTVSGGGSILNLPMLTNIAGGGFECSWNIQALAGGQLDASNLLAIQEAGAPGSGLTLTADGAGSVIDFSGLQNSSGGGPITFQASNGGTVKLPGLLNGPNITVVLNNGSTVLANEVRQLGGIVASDVTASFASLTNFDGGSFNISSGAVITLPALQNAALGCGGTWTVSGAGSVLNLPGLTNMTGGGFDCSWTIQALAGGQLEASNLLAVQEVSSPGSGLTVTADGTNSVIDFSGLQNSSGGGPITVQASNGGLVKLPSLIGGGNITVVLNDNGTIVATQAQQLGGITASDTTASFPSLTNFDGGAFSISAGATVTLAALRQVSIGCNQDWTITGTNSVLNLPALTNLTGGTFHCSATIEALAGGQLTATNLAGIEEDAGGSGSTLTVIADGAGSLVDFSKLQTTTGSGFVIFEASDAGLIRLTGLVGGPNIQVILNNNGTLLANQAQQLGAITVSNVTASFPSLTNFSGGSFNVSGGATLTLPALAQMSMGCGQDWTITGTNSVLNLPALTNLTGGGFQCGAVIQALMGGQLTATNLAAIEEATGGGGPTLMVIADGTNSVIDFSGLQPVSGDGPVIFQAGDGATLKLPKLVGGPNVDLIYNPNGTLLANAVRQLGALTVSNVTVTLPALTNFDGGSLNISDGAVVTLPALGNYSCMNDGPTWEVTGAGSMLNLSGLTNLLGSFCCAFNVEALAGGQLLLNNLVSIQNGNVSFLADGAGSLINLSQLSGFTSSTGKGQITAQNGGTIVFNNQAFVLDNVGINIPAGNPFLPPTLIASQGLTLYGIPFHSYRVETRNTLIPNSPWVLLTLVPLTNTFQMFAGAQPANTAFRVTDFVASQPILQISLTPQKQTQLVLYGGIDDSYQIQTATNLAPPVIWTPGSVVMLTNAFRIFAPVTPVGTLFYRAEQQ